MASSFIFFFFEAEWCTGCSQFWNANLRFIILFFWFLCDSGNISNLVANEGRLHDFMSVISIQKIFCIKKRKAKQTQITCSEKKEKKQ